MAQGIKKLVATLAVMAGALAQSGCLSIQAIEPVIDPPGYFQADVTVPVEFISPMSIGLRCAERGAKFLGLPGLNSGACADADLVTMPDPCMTLTAGDYAKVLCEGIAIAVAETRQTQPSAPQIAKPTSPTGFPQLTRIGYHSETFSQAAPKTTVSARPTQSAPLVEFVASDQLAFRCAERGAKFTSAQAFGAAACADTSLITMANPCGHEAESWYARTLCHELAHANGWPADHGPGVPPGIRLASQSPKALANKATAEKPATPDLKLPELKTPYMYKIVDARLATARLQRLLTSPGAPIVLKSLRLVGGQRISPSTMADFFVPREDRRHAGGSEELMNTLAAVEGNFRDLRLSLGKASVANDDTASTPYSASQVSSD